MKVFGWLSGSFWAMFFLFGCIKADNTDKKLWVLDIYQAWALAVDARADSLHSHKLYKLSLADIPEEVKLLSHNGTPLGDMYDVAGIYEMSKDYMLLVLSPWKSAPNQYESYLVRFPNGTVERLPNGFYPTSWQTLQLDSNTKALAKGDTTVFYFLNGTNICSIDLTSGRLRTSTMYLPYTPNGPLHVSVGDLLMAGNQLVVKKDSVVTVNEYSATSSHIVRNYNSGFVLTNQNNAEITHLSIKVENYQVTIDTLKSFSLPEATATYVQACSFPSQQISLIVYSCGIERISPGGCEFYPLSKFNLKSIELVSKSDEYMYVSGVNLADRTVLYKFANTSSGNLAYSDAFTGNKFRLSLLHANAGDQVAFKAVRLADNVPVYGYFSNTQFRLSEDLLGFNCRQIIPVR